MIYSLNDREIVDLEVEDISMRDYPDFCDAYVSYAVWADTKKPLTDDELDQYNDLCRDQVYDAVMKRIF
jgi:hypothetical protein